MAEMLGNEYDDFLTCLQHQSVTGLRVNTLKLSPDEYLSRSPFQLKHVPWCSSGFIVIPAVDNNSISPGKHPYHYAGLYYLQEPSAMAAAEILAPLPGEKVLDLAAAPGGKAQHLAALMENTGLLVANEIHPKRVWDLVENLERCGVTNAIVTNENPNKLADHFDGYFDRVLLDAPCSGEGMFRKSEPARREWKPDLVRSCALRQTSILEQAARMVKSGGHLAYTTCTFSAEENEGVIATFLHQHPEFALAATHMAVGFQPAKPEWVGLPADHMLSRAVRIWPHIAPAEGHFIALLAKQGSAEKYRAAKSKELHHHRDRTWSNKGKNSTWSVLDDFYKAHLTMPIDASRMIVDGTYVYQMGEHLPDLNGLKLIRPGWWLGSISKGRFTPSHSMAMGISANYARQVLTLQSGDRRLIAYLAGESFPDPGENGWVLVTVEGYPVGWGKRVQNVLKNFYPHGLRRSI